jgi:hypothetical protein
VSDPPKPVHEISTRETIVGGVTTSLRRLDPNMLAVLLLVTVMNGLFFWAYAQSMNLKHIEFLEALKTCAVQPSSLFPRSTP